MLTDIQKDKQKLKWDLQHNPSAVAADKADLHSDYRDLRKDVKDVKSDRADLANDQH